MGLHSALQWYVKGSLSAARLPRSLKFPRHPDRLPPDYELCLFRVAQECLTNIHRHSGSSTAVVRLLQTPEEIKLEVKDDGRGMDRETRSTLAAGAGVGVGLRGMRERLRRLGGDLANRVQRKRHPSGRNFTGGASEDSQRQSIVAALTIRPLNGGGVSQKQASLQ